MINLMASSVKSTFAADIFIKTSSVESLKLLTFDEIEKLYQQQVASQRIKSFIVYRGQGLSTADFEKLLKTKNGLLSFNNVLSTSEKYDFSFDYAEMALTKTDMIDVLFSIFVAPRVSSIPFAFFEKLSYFQTEAEVLFPSTLSFV